MNVEKLIRMANQIGDFFEADPNTEHAKEEIASHIKRFWNSVMIQGIVTHVKEHRGDGLHPCVAEAIRQYLG